MRWVGRRRVGRETGPAGSHTVRIAAYPRLSHLRPGWVLVQDQRSVEREEEVRELRLTGGVDARDLEANRPRRARPERHADAVGPPGDERHARAVRGHTGLDHRQ